MNEPRKLIRAYKLFRLKAGELYPLFIDKKTSVPVGDWLPAKFVPTKGFAKRPGWHAGVLPTAPHLRSKAGRIAKARVWALVEMGADRDWQVIADRAPRKDIRDRVPTGGSYRFKTSKMQGGAWLIGGELKIVKVLSCDEVRKVLIKAGDHAAAEAETHA